MTKKTILIIPFIDNWGHIYPGIGIGQQLLQKGHRVIFAIEKSWKGKLEKFGFEEELMYLDDNDSNMQASESTIQSIIECGLMNHDSPFEKFKNLFLNFMNLESKLELFKYSNNYINLIKKASLLIEEIINKIKPDVTIVDAFMMSSLVVKAKKPWILLYPANPLGITLSDLPLPFLGSPLNTANEWNKYASSFLDEFLSLVINWYGSVDGLEEIINKKSWFVHSPYLNIYSYPKELDYIDIRPLPKNWARFDLFNRIESQPFDFPEKLKNKSGKLIYFSLGSIGSGNVDLMKKFVGFLSKSQHRFIVSKGLYGDQYDLPENCWGENHLPQINVLNIVDFVICHGGNNSICEIFYFGKPMIVMPLFSDQYDNAQRIDEKGFGIRLDPYKCTKQELLHAIDKLASDDNLNQRMKVISERIKRDLKSSNLVELIENVANNFSLNS